MKDIPVTHGSCDVFFITLQPKSIKMATEETIFLRSELLLGSERMNQIAQKRVIIFGVGGVGSWCAESLVRSGISQLTIVDSDCVCVSNINRQLMATTKTVGQAKLKDKAALILLACQTKAKLFSSMGAALKLDPTRIRVTEFWKVQGDPLARALRKKFKSQKQFPKHKFQVVYSDELLENRGHIDTEGHVNGSLVHITAVFGFTLAGLVIQDIVSL